MLFIATAEGQDDEMGARIAAHRSERPPDRLTLEILHHVAEAFTRCSPPADVVLLDCLTLLISNLLLLEGDIDQPDTARTDGFAHRLEAEIQALLEAIRGSCAD